MRFARPPRPFEIHYLDPGSLMRSSRLALITAVLAVCPAAAQDVEDFGYTEYRPAAGGQPEMVVLTDISNDGEVRWTCTPGGLRFTMRSEHGGPVDGRIQVEFDNEGSEALRTAPGDSAWFVLSGDAEAFTRRAWMSNWLVLFPLIASGQEYPLAFRLKHVDEALSRLSCVPPVRDERGNLRWAGPDTAPRPAGVRAAYHRNSQTFEVISGGSFGGTARPETFQEAEERRRIAADTAVGGPTRFTNASQVPRFMRNNYPRTLRSQAVEGTAELELTVAADGRVLDSSVLRTSRGAFTLPTVGVAGMLIFNRAAERIRIVRVHLRWHPDTPEASIVDQ
jgi:uncharacterized cupin superfamily protein